MWSTTDLIVAPATPSGPGARAIVRVAGDGLDALLRGLVVPEPPGFPRAGEPPRAVAARFGPDSLGRTWGPLAVDVLHWPGPTGPIGGPLAELQLPCSGPLVDAVVAAACRHGGRLARGGEFTLRAFLAGRLDLLQAESVLAVVDARSPTELQAALDRLAGAAGRGLVRVRGRLLDLLADIEASIDFADETAPDAVPVAPAWPLVAARLADCDAALAALAHDLARRDGSATDLPRVVFAGRPNIGKSSLVNAVVGRDVALVADEPGTTRDWLEARPAAGSGLPACVVVDIAGIDAAGTGCAAERLARAISARADVVVACRAADAPAADLPPVVGTASVEVLTRCDRVAIRSWPDAAIATSSLTGAGIHELRRAITAALLELPARATPATLRMRVGMCETVREITAASALVRAAAAGDTVDESLVAGHLRRAGDALGEITGERIDVDLLDRIFARHCVGK